MKMDQFYHEYLLQHQNLTNRRLHVLGTVGMIGVLILTASLKRPTLLLLLPVVGYTPAWIGHFLYERNRPATFQHPLKSFLCDLLMFRDICLGRVCLSRKGDTRPVANEGKQK
jgi:hypothetical protein